MTELTDSLVAAINAQNALSKGLSSISNVIEGNRIPMLMTIFDEFDNETAVQEGDTPVALVTSSVTGRFFLAQSDDTPVANVVIPVNQSGRIFYYEDPTPGEPVINATPAPPPGARDITPTTAPIVIRRVGRLDASPSDITTQILVRERIVVSLRADTGEPVRAANPGVPVDLSTSSGTGRFYLNPVDVNPINQVTILPAESVTIVYYADSTLGTHTLSFRGTGIPDSLDTVNITVKEGPGIAMNSTAVVPNGFTGRTTQMGMTLRDQLGNVISGGANQLAVSVVAGPNAGATMSAITDIGNGQYGVTYVPTSRGVDQIRILVNGTEMAGSPFQSVVGTRVPARLELVSGDTQSAPIQTIAANPMVVRLIDDQGDVLPDATITFAVSSAPEGATGASLSATTVMTDANGLASSTLTMGNRIGSYVVNASIDAVAPVTFTTTATPCVTDCSLSYEVTVSSTTPYVSTEISVRAQLKDQFGNPTPISDRVVTWSTSLAAGRFGSSTSTTDANGSATTTYSVGNVVGTQHLLTAMDAAGVRGESARLTVQGGVLSSFQIMGPDTLRVAQNGGPFTLVLRDEFGHEILANESFTFSISIENSLNLSISDADVSNARYRVSGNRITLDAGESRARFMVNQNRSGTRKMTATPVGITELVPATKMVHFLVAELTTMSLSAGQGQQQRVSEELAEQLSVTLRDQFDNPVPNRSVTFKLTDIPVGAEGMEMSAANNARLRQPAPEGIEVTVTTDANGKAGVLFRLGSRAGDYSIVATTSGLDPVEFTVVGLPTTYVLYQNYPNPFNPSTNILFDLPLDSEVRLVIYDILGRRVAVLAEGVYAAGLHSVEWNTSGLTLASGVYVYQLEAKGVVDGNLYVRTRKLTIMK